MLMNGMKINVVKDIFMVDEAKKILSYNVNDGWYLYFDWKCYFVVRGAYKLLCSYQNPNDGSLAMDWRKLWYLDIPSKV